MSAAVVKRNKKPIGMVHGGYILDEGLLRSLCPSDDVDVALFDHAGVLSVATGAIDVDQQLVEETFQEVASACAEDPEGSVCRDLQFRIATTHMEGKPYLLDVTPIRLTSEAPVGVVVVAKPASKMAREIQRYRNIGGGLMIGFSSVAILFGVIIARNVVRPLNRTIKMLRELSEGEGDLTKRLNVTSRDEVGELAKWFNVFVDKLQRMVGAMGSSAAKMEAASSEQAVGANNQSTATTEMSATVSELLTNARQVAESGTSVSEQASTAADECASGTKSIQDAVRGITGIRDRVERVAEHMVDLGGRSQQVSGVLDIINELAEQTNLLSLNASIEAAGAGEAGKRFAVVASEIRKLAERAGESTTEIRELIDSIQQTVNATILATEEGTKAVKHGVCLTEEAEGSFERIASQVASTRESAKAIEMASRQQATALEQLDGAVRNIDSTAQRAEASSRQVQTEAQRLAQAAGRFRTGRQRTYTR